MTLPSCPACGRLVASVVPRVSPDVAVTYYRCDLCGHVWVMFTDGRPIHHVTPLPDVEQAG